MISTLAAQAALLVRQTHRAWRYYRLLNYTWHLSWYKAGSQV